VDIDGGPDVDDEELGNEALCEDGRLDFDDEDVLRDRQADRQTQEGRDGATNAHQACLVML
jgi:hypothetical protein